ncbi:MAG: ABC transporter ATP-binding protein [Wenzhouxiangella sp.]
MSSEVVLDITGLGRSFNSGASQIEILKRLDLQLDRGERVAIMGTSGAGKTTLLHLAAGMDRPDRGTVELAGRDLARLDEPALSQHRARHVGLVFQDFNLIDSLTAFENIELALWLNGQRQSGARIRQLAGQLGIARLLQRLPSQLSGGERQRVAIARALIHQPALVLADEPTGSLDEETASDVLDLFDQACRDTGCALLMVTHDREAAKICDRLTRLHLGRLEAV